MSSAATLDSRHSSDATPATTPREAKLRLVPAFVFLAIFWALLYANGIMDLPAAARFLSRMGTYAIAMLAFLIWWLSRSSIRWRDRLLALVVAIVIGIITRQFTDKTIDGFGLLLISFPVLVTGWLVWVAIAQRWWPRTQRIGFCLLMVCIFGFFTLRRFDGLRGAQTGDMSWRWTATHEQDFMTTRATVAKHLAPANEAKKWTLQPGDCAEFRGQERDGVLRGISVVPDWQEHPPKLLWKKKVGPGWSGMIVVDGHLVTQEQRGEVESVVCYDAATGDELWAHDDHVRFEESLAGAGPRGTPTFAAGRIFALGARGTLNCLTPETGAVLWSRDIMKDGDVEPSEMPQWGFSVSPLVVDNLVIVFAGGTKGKSIIAYKVADGSIAWARPGGKQSYSSPQLATLAGKKQIAMHDTAAIRVLNIADGVEQWSNANESELALPMLQPHVVAPNDLVVSTSPGMARLEVRGKPGDAPAPRWATNKLRPDFSDFVIHKGLLYGLNNGILCCLDVESGNLVWKKSRLGFGQIVLLADQDALLVSNEKGEIILVSIGREGPKELGRFQAIEGKTWNGPVLVGNRVFLRNAAEMAAYELSVQNSKSQSPAGASQKSSL